MFSVPSAVNQIRVHTVTIVDHPLAAAKLSILRAKTTRPDEFRRNLQELSIILLTDATHAWETREIEIETPLKKCAGKILAGPVVIVPILRAGLGMIDGMSRFLPEANVGHIGIYRDEKSLRPTTYFCRLPSELSASQVVLVDPMLATGHSACAALELLKKNGAAKIQFITLVACDAGIQQVHSQHADVQIITAAVDPELNESGYIVPGLGDAGDRYFGTL
ncbi:MAG: uracil phosphoribosyltransferase [Verrucomicrobiota bacterium]